MEKQIKKIIDESLGYLLIKDVNFVVEHPEDLKNGDYSTNVALACAKALGRSPREIADEIAKKINENLPEGIERVEVAGAGFINFHLSPKFFHGSIEEILNNKNFGHNKIFTGKKIMIEYTDPNPFKPFHIGHLMSNSIGESLSRILEHSGAEVARANYQGDVGLHVARAIYELLRNEKLSDRSGTHAEQAKRIGEAYARGSEAYENDEKAKTKIDAINKKVYDKSDEEINEIYDWGFKATMEAFEDLYRMLGTKFDYYFLESQMAPIGEKLVRENLGRVFEESDGAIVFKADKYDPKLHTRVFITSGGLPTYEGKELGLTEEKFKTEPTLDLSIVVTASEQADYMRVVTKALSLIHPEFTDKMLHITHGMMRLASGKMSSRKGNVVTGESLLAEARGAILKKIEERDFTEQEKQEVSAAVGVAALKYSILKQSTVGDIIYDFEKSISFEGDSGPYLQYSHARAKSILQKAQAENILPDPHAGTGEVAEVEKLLYRFGEVVTRAAEEFEPHYIANYLIEVARSFNSFYGNTLIVKKGDKTSGYKVALTYAFTFIIKSGLHLLGIEAPEKM